MEPGEKTVENSSTVNKEKKNSVNPDREKKKQELFVILKTLLLQMEDKPPHVVINILVHLDFNLIVLLAEQESSIREAFNSEQFYKEYLKLHYNKGIVEEKDKDVTYKELFYYIKRCENISEDLEIDYIVTTGKYHLLKYLLSLPLYNINMVTHEQIALCQNIDMLQLYIDEKKKNFLNRNKENSNGIIQGSGHFNATEEGELFGYQIDQRSENIQMMRYSIRTDNVEWFHHVINVLEIESHYVLIIEAFKYNCLNMLKEFHRKMNYNLRISISESYPGLDFVILEKLLLSLLISYNDCNSDDSDSNDKKNKNSKDRTADNNIKLISLLNYVFIEEKLLDVDYFILNMERSTLEMPHMEISDPQNDLHFKQMKKLMYYIGSTGNEDIINFFLNTMSILCEFKENRKKILIGRLLNGICRSGNVLTLKVYFKMYSNLFGILICDDNIDYDFPSTIRYIITVENIIRSNSIEMISAFQKLNLLKLPDKYKINPIVYTVSCETLQIFDLLYESFFIKYTDEEFMKDILNTKSGLYYLNSYKPLLLQLRERGLVDPYQMITMLLNNNTDVDYEDKIKKIIWIFKIEIDNMIDHIIKICDILNITQCTRIRTLRTILYNISYLNKKQFHELSEGINNK